MTVITTIPPGRQLSVLREQLARWQTTLFEAQIEQEIAQAIDNVTLDEQAAAKMTAAQYAIQLLNEKIKALDRSA